METENKARLEIAADLMDEFARRTGLKDVGGDLRRRYLWTDAFAVQAFLALENATNVTYGLDGLDGLSTAKISPLR